MFALKQRRPAARAERSPAAEGAPLSVTHVPRRFTPRAWGGTESVVLATARHQRRMGHDARILTTRALDPGPRDELEGVPVERHRYFYPYYGLEDGARECLDRKGGNLVSFGLMLSLLRGPRPDIVHLHTGKRLAGMVRVAARLRRCPYVVTLHGGCCDVPADEARSLVEPTRGAFEWGKALGWALGSRRILEDASAILAVGRGEAERLQSLLPHKKVVYFPHAVEAGAFRSGDGARFRRELGIPGSARVLVSVGRIDAQKDPVFLVEAVAQLRRTRPEVHLVLVGPVTDRECDEQLERRIAALGLRGAVHRIPGLPPESPALAAAYHAADAVVLASRHEPFGVVVLESWAAGRPVIVPRVGGLVDLVRDGRDGLLYERGDTGAFLSHVQEVLANPSVASTLAIGGLERVSRGFSWEGRTRELLTIYREVIHENPVRE